MAAIEMLAISSYLSSSTQIQLSLKPLPTSSLYISTHYPNLSLKSLSYPSFPLLSINPTKKKCSQLNFSTLEEPENGVAVQEEENAEKPQKINQGKKLFVQNLPWSFTVDEIKNLFGESGTVEDVQVIKNKDGKRTSFTFVTMASVEEAQAAINKLDSFELLGRIIKVEFARKVKKLGGAPPPKGETRYKLFASNLSWRVRSIHLREFFSENHNPVSTRVILNNTSGGGYVYGFVSFDSKEEAEAALSALDGKELMGRPIQLKFNEEDADKSKNEEGAATQENPEELSDTNT